MPIPVSYNTQGGGFLDLATIQQRQQQIKQEQQQAQQKQVMDAITMIAGALQKEQQKKEMAKAVAQAQKEGKQIKQVYDSEGGTKYEIGEPKELDYGKLLQGIKFGIASGQIDTKGMNKKQLSALGFKTTKVSAKEQLTQDLYKRYQGGDRSPEVLKGLGMFTENQGMQPIVDEMGNVIGERPTGSVFQPQGVNINTADISQAQKLIPWWENLLPGAQTQEAKDVQSMRKKLVEGKLGKVSKETIKTKSVKSAEERFNELIKSGMKESEVYKQLKKEGF